jgi:putative flippase GtrA
MNRPPLPSFLAKRPQLRAFCTRFLRFGIVGVVASAIHYGIYALLIWLGYGENLAYSFGFLFSLCCNYVLTTYFTFRQRPSKRNVAGFIASHVLNYFVEIGLLNLFLWMGFSRWLAPIMDMAVAAFINFLVLQFAYLYRRE